MFSRQVKSYLADIVEDADQLTGFILGTDIDAFVADQKTVLAVERLFQRITEAVIRIGPDDMARVGAEIPVSKIRAFGNRLRHNYDDIDPRLLLQTAWDDLPPLRAAAAAALDAHGD